MLTTSGIWVDTRRRRNIRSDPNCQCRQYRGADSKRVRGETEKRGWYPEFDAVEGRDEEFDDADQGDEEIELVGGVLEVGVRVRGDLDERLDHEEDQAHEVDPPGRLLVLDRVPKVRRRERNAVHDHDPIRQQPELP
eukprot:2397036-Rhodomonas_salina.1